MLKGPYLVLGIELGLASYLLYYFSSTRIAFKTGRVVEDLSDEVIFDLI